MSTLLVTEDVEKGSFSHRNNMVVHTRVHLPNKMDSKNLVMFIQFVFNFIGLIRYIQYNSI